MLGVVSLGWAPGLQTLFPESTILPPQPAPLPTTSPLPDCLLLIPTSYPASPSHRGPPARQRSPEGFVPAASRAVWALCGRQSTPTVLCWAPAQRLTLSSFSRCK